MSEALPSGERPEPLLAKQVLQHVASHWIMNRMERFRRIQPRHVAQRLSHAPEPRLHLDPAEWRTGFLNVRDYDPPQELLNDLREVAPQALLRDLFRPESEYANSWERQEPRDIAGIEGMRWARASRVRDPLPHISSGLTVVRQMQEHRRRFLQERWKPITPDDKRDQGDATLGGRGRRGF